MQRMRAVPWPTSAAAAAATGIVHIGFHKSRKTLALCHNIRKPWLGSR